MEHNDVTVLPDRPIGQLDTGGRGLCYYPTYACVAKVSGRSKQSTRDMFSIDFARNPETAYRYLQHGMDQVLTLRAGTL